MLPQARDRPRCQAGHGKAMDERASQVSETDLRGHALLEAGHGPWNRRPALHRPMCLRPARLFRTRPKHLLSVQGCLAISLMSCSTRKVRSEGDERPRIEELQQHEQIAVLPGSGR